MDHLVNNIIYGDNDEVFNNADTVDPWDVILQFRSSNIPQLLFNLVPLTEEEDQYDDTPITVDIDVIIDDRKFKHQMSKELVKGIIIFYKEFGLQHPLSLYGKTFNYETHEILPTTGVPYGNYIVQVGQNMYIFF